MKIEKSEIARKLAKLKAAIPDKSAISGVRGVLIKNNQAIASNFEIGITVTSLSTDPDIADEPFILCAKAIEMIESLPDGEIEIVPDGSVVRVITKTIKNKFPKLDPAEFVEPQPPSGEKESIKISSGKLLKMAQSVLFAAATNDSKPVHTGALFEACNGELNVVAVDGYRLAWNKAEFDGDFKFIVPRSSMDKLLKVGMTGDIEIAHCGNTAVFMSEEYTVHTRLLNGEFLNYREAVPKHEKEIVINRKALLDGIERVMICGDRELKAIAVIAFEGEKMILSTNTAMANYSEEIEIHGAPDEGLRIGFNPVYLRDSVKACDSEFITMSFKDPLSPLIISDDMLLTLCLPVRLKENT